MYIGIIYLISCADYGLTKNTDYNDAAIDSDSAAILDTKIVNDSVDTIDTTDTAIIVDTEDTAEVVDTEGGFVFEPYNETLAVGHYHYCGILANQDVYCAGNVAPSSPSGKFTMVTGSNEFTYCGIKTNGYVACWGNGLMSYLFETSSGGSVYSPPSDKFVDIAAGSATACGVRDDSSVTCWGYSLYLGSEPTSSGWTQIAGDDGVWCALDLEGYAYCWVAPFFAEYYSGLISAPTERFSKITFGGLKFCGITTDEKLICWGSDVNNSYFESTIKSSVGPNISRISSGGQDYSYEWEAPSDTCIVYSDGSGQCYGTNSNNELPAQVSESSSVYNQIVSSHAISYTCSLMNDGSLICYSSWSDPWDDSWDSQPPGTFYTL